MEERSRDSHSKTWRKPDITQNHRTISLLNSTAKLAEKIILRRLKEELEDKEIIPPEQFGFREEHSTEQQALRLTENIINFSNWNHVSTAIFFDVSKAFDKVWHEGLLFKMNEFNISIPLIRITASYLKNRSFQVKVGDAKSTKTKMSGGVAQGGVLSPNLYNIYTADIPKNSGLDTKVFTYADDTAILTHSRNLNLASRYLQTAADSILDWMKQWKIKINPNKTQAIVFSKKNTLPSEELVIEETKIPWRNEIKYLGIIFDKKNDLETAYRLN